MVRNGDAGDGQIGRSVAILHFGGLGDVVLLSECVARWREAEPDARLIVFCRAAFAPAISCYAVVPDRVVSIDIDPYGKERLTREIVSNARSAFAIGESVDFVACPELRPTWLSYVGIDALRPLGVAIADPVPPAALRAFIAHPVDGEALAPEVRADARRLLAAVVPHTGELQAMLPRLVVEAAPAAKPRPYLAVFPLGESRIPFKVWPAANFARALPEIATRLDLDVVLVGGAGERPALEALAAALPQGRATIFAGSPDELPACFALLAGAAGYLGNDTGLAHAAAALGRPGVTVFGGGTWPAYRPWAPGAIGVVAPMACFGCAWNCLFDRGFCVEAIEVEPVVTALRAAIAQPAAEPRVIEVESVSGPAAEVVAGAAERARRIAADARADEERKAEHVAKLLAATERLGRIALAAPPEPEPAPPPPVDEAALERAERERARETGDLRDRIVELEAYVATLETDLYRLRESDVALTTRLETSEAAARERLALVVEASEEAKRVYAEAEKRSVLIADLTALIKTQHGQIEQYQRRIAEATSGRKGRR